MDSQELGLTSVLLYFHVERPTTKIRMSQIWKREYPFLAAAIPLLCQEGVPPPFVQRWHPPLTGNKRGVGYHAFKKSVGGWGYLSFLGAGGTPLARKEAPTPQAIGGKNIPSDDNSTRSTGFGNAGKGG